MELIDFLETAFDMEYRMAQLVKRLVGRPMQVAMVKGLKRYLSKRQPCTHTPDGARELTPPRLLCYPISELFSET